MTLNLVSLPIIFLQSVQLRSGRVSELVVGTSLLLLLDGNF